MILLRSDHNPTLEHNTPGTFPALMDLYERNYINMRRLLPKIPAASTAIVSDVPGTLKLHLQVLERFRYTSELILTYQFKQDQVMIAEPNLRIRIYHDARQAEATHARFRRAVTISKKQDLDDAPLYARWRVNRFLYKWLNYCLHQGHCFQLET